VEKAVALLTGNFEGDETETLSRDDGPLTLAANDACLELHKSPPRRTLQAALFLGATCSSLFAARARTHQLKPLAQKFQQLLAGTKSQLRAGINFFNPAFEPAVRRLRFWS
jgi:hypothetical protein